MGKEPEVGAYLAVQGTKWQSDWSRLSKGVENLRSGSVEIPPSMTRGAVSGLNIYVRCSDSH